MEVAVIVAIFVSILGLTIILALVWLLYKWRTVHNVVEHPPGTDKSPPLRRLVVEHGRTVSVTGPRPPSAVSGWSSVGHRSWLMSGFSRARNDDAAARKSKNIVTTTFCLGPNLEQGITEEGAQRQVDSQTTSTSTERLCLPHIHQSPPLPMAATSDRRRSATSDLSPSKALPALPPTSETGPNIADHPYERHTPRRKQMPGRLDLETPGPPSPPPSGRTFLDPPSIETLRAFPKPPYLSPLQSRYHMQPQTSLRPPTPAPYYEQRRISMTSSATHDFEGNEECPPPFARPWSPQQATSTETSSTFLTAKSRSSTPDDEQDHHIIL